MQIKIDQRKASAVEHLRMIRVDADRCFILIAVSPEQTIFLVNISFFIEAVLPEVDVCIMVTIQSSKPTALGT